MDKGTEIYRELIDSLVEKSRSCVCANWVKNIALNANTDESKRLKSVVESLTPEQREVLADNTLGAYMDGIYDTLCELEWYIDCKEMEITVEGEKLPTTKFEGLGNDFIGRRDGWEWPDDSED